MQSKVLIIIAVLVIGTGVAVYAILNSSSQPPNPFVSQNGNKPKPETLEQLIAQFPSESSTPAQIQAFNTKIKALAVEANTLDVTDCAINPKIMHIRLKKSFTIRNKGAAERLITHLPQFSEVIPPATDKLVTPNFTDGGVYGYRCDRKIAGIFFVTQE